jgi:hypothetical protein
VFLIKPAKHKRLFSAFMVVAFLATSTLVCAAATINNLDDISQEIEDDKDEVDEKGSEFDAGLHFICDVVDWRQTTTTVAPIFITEYYSPAHSHLFLMHHRLLI